MPVLTKNYSLAGQRFNIIREEVQISKMPTNTLVHFK